MKIQVCHVSKHQIRINENRGTKRMFAAMRRPAAELENADVLALCEKLALPERPASLQLAETTLRALKKERGEINAECSASMARDRDRDLQSPSTESKHLQAKVDELDGKVKASRLVVEEERKKWQPRFRDALALPVSAADDLLQFELARLDLISKALLNAHTYAVYCGIDSPYGRAPALINAVRDLRIALNSNLGR